MWEVSCWSARSRAAVRTNELDADERRPIMEGEEGPFMLGCEGLVSVPGMWWAEWSHKHPFGSPPEVAGAMTMCPGPGCSVR